MTEPDAARRRLDWVALVLLGIFALGRLAIVLQGKVFTSFDTFSYAYRDDPAWDRGALVSFVGHAPRPWGAPLFFVLFTDDQSRAVGQWAVGTLAWAFLAFAVYRLLRHRVARWAALAAILLLGLSRTVSSWDFTILSESLSISLGVAALALFLWWMRTRAIWALAMMIAICVWWMYTRVDIFIMAAPIGAALLWFGWRHSRTRGGQAALAGALILAISAGLSYLVVGPNSLQTHKKWSFAPEMSHERGLLMYRLRISVFADPKVKAAFQRELHMPECGAVDQVVERGGGWAIEQFDAAVRQCPEMQAWAVENESGLWTRYATTMPGLFARQIGELTSASLRGAAYADTPALLTVPIEKLVFYKRHALPLSLAALALSLLLALACGARRAHPRLLLTGIAVAATALVSSVLTVIVSSGEVWRFGIQEAIAVRIAVVILLAIALDSWLTPKAYIEAMSRSTRSS